jgi:hypothetical protein
MKLLRTAASFLLNILLAVVGTSVFKLPLINLTGLSLDRALRREYIFCAFVSFSGDGAQARPSGFGQQGLFGSGRELFLFGSNNTRCFLDLPTPFSASSREGIAVRTSRAAAGMPSITRFHSWRRFSIPPGPLFVAGGEIVPCLTPGVITPSRKGGDKEKPVHCGRGSGSQAEACATWPVFGSVCVPMASHAIPLGPHPASASALSPTPEYDPPRPADGRSTASRCGYSRPRFRRINRPRRSSAARAFDPHAHPAT